MPVVGDCDSGVACCVLSEGSERVCGVRCLLMMPGHNHVQIMCNTSSACHVQHVVLCASSYEGTSQLLSLTEFKYMHLFELYLLAEPVTDEGWDGGGGAEDRRALRKPLMTSFRKCLILNPKNPSPNRDFNIGSRLGKQMY